MKELLLTKDSLANKISYYHLLFLMASLPFDMFYSHLILISFAVHTLIQIKRSQIKSFFNWRTTTLASVFLLTVASTVYSINKPEAFVEWGRQIIMLLFPLLFCFTGLDIKKYRQPLLLGFSLVCTFTIAYLFFDAFHTIRYYGLPLSAITSSSFTNHNFSAPINIHATFFSMQLMLALTYLISVLINKRNIYAQMFYAACIGLLAIGLFQLSSKSVFFCMFFIVNLAVPYFLLEKGRRRRFMTISFALSGFALIAVLCLKTFKERIVTDLRKDLSVRKTNETVDPRLARWAAAAELIIKSPIIGHGSGTEIALLHEVYFQKKYYSSFLNKLNAHNQYLSFLLKSGIIGLAIYLATLTFGFRSALENKDILYFSFMMVITFVSFSENYLDVEKGVIFYAFFFSFFSFSNDKRMEKERQISMSTKPVEHGYLEELATN